MHRMMANGGQMSKMIAVSDMSKTGIDDDTFGQKLAKCSPCRVEVFSA